MPFHQERAGAERSGGRFVRPCGWAKRRSSGRGREDPEAVAVGIGCGEREPEVHLHGYLDDCQAARHPVRIAGPHGGIIGLLVDEMLVYAGAPHDLWGMTAKVRYWLRKPIPLEGVELVLRGRMIQQSGRGFRAVVSVHSGDTLGAEGEGMCVLRADPGAPQ